MPSSSFKHHLRANQTNAEWKLWNYLRAKRFYGYKFRRQVQLGPYIVDFVCHQQRLIIECDGGQHQQREIVKYDTTRTQFLKSQSYDIIRFWNHEILDNINSVLEVILKHLSCSFSPLPPS